MKSRYWMILTALVTLSFVGCRTPTEKAAPPPPTPPEIVMTQRLESEDPQVRLSAEEELLHGGADSIPLLKKMLDGQKVTEEGPTLPQKAAIRVLGYLAEKDPEAREKATNILIEMVADGPKPLAGYAAAALKPQGVSLFPKLIPRALNDRREESRVMRSLMIGIDEFATIDLLIKMLSDPPTRPAGVSEDQVIDALREFTHQNFGYHRDNSSMDRANSLQRWIDWWSRERPYFKNPLRPEEFLAEQSTKGE